MCHYGAAAAASMASSDEDEKISVQCSFRVLTAFLEKINSKVVIIDNDRNNSCVQTENPQIGRAFRLSKYSKQLKPKSFKASPLTIRSLDFLLSLR